MDAEFWHMGGFAFYVWGAYGAAVAVFAWNLVMPRLRRRALRRALSESTTPPARAHAHGLPEPQP
ncbi:MAG TPA: heme exporter protein CcmD [Rhodanobacteraceae bacterium]|nr:heme exporter protein CcmD [Rhodanobacteraceae bacterium]